MERSDAAAQDIAVPARGLSAILDTQFSQREHCRVIHTCPDRRHLCHDWYVVPGIGVVNEAEGRPRGRVQEHGRA